MKNKKVAFADLPKGYLQFNYSHVPVGKSIDVESVEVVDHHSEKSGKTTKVFEVKLANIGLPIKVLPTRALEGQLAEADNEGIIWQAKSLTRVEDTELSA